jgi:DNA-binding CsgD family transcriptional regulator
VRFFLVPAQKQMPGELTPRELAVLSWTGEGKTLPHDRQMQ